jgi:hypothetical protein
MNLLEQIRKVLADAPEWTKYPLVVPKEIVDDIRRK